MEGKVLLQDLAQSLATKRNIQRKDAEAFLKAFFETISDGILRDKIVKVKGLGTFKMIEVQDRESVNVNTGERIVIPGHSKISFTPDAELKDQVNKPFAFFQTVIINEGTSIEDMEKMDVTIQDEGLPVTDDCSEKLSTLVRLEALDNSKIPEVPEKLVKPEDPEMPMVQEVQGVQEVQEVQGVQEVQEVQGVQEVQEVQGVQEVQDIQGVQDVQEVQGVQGDSGVAHLSNSNESKWWHISPAMLALLFAFFWIVLLIGYFIGKNNWVNIGWNINKHVQEPIVKVDTVYVVKTVGTDTLYIQAMEDSLRNVILEEGKVKREETRKEENLKEQPKVNVPQAAKIETKPIEPKKRGPIAYEIVGQKGVRTIKWGDYLLKIVREEYGTDDALKYVIIYNKFTDPNNVPVGTEVKLPRLKEK